MSGGIQYGTQCAQEFFAKDLACVSCGGELSNTWPADMMHTIRCIHDRLRRIEEKIDAGVRVRDGEDEGGGDDPD